MTGDDIEVGTHPDYREVIDILEGGDKEACGRLAANPHTAPEVLYFLAGADEPDIRAKVALNDCTPYQADWVLSDDPAEEVRGGLVGKTVSRLAELDPHSTDRIVETARSVLRRLAEDQCVAIRQLLAEEAKASRSVPVDVVERLARDTDPRVACPVLQHSPLLDDSFLIGLIGEHLTAPALVSISSRPDVGPDLSARIVDTMDRRAVTALLSNDNAQIREDTLDLIAKSAERVTEWQEPLVSRPGLPVSAIRIISEFVADNLLARLAEHEGLDGDTMTLLRERMQQRLVEVTVAEHDRERVVAEVLRELKRLKEQGRLNANYVEDAIEDGRRMHVWIALGLLSETTTEFAYRVFSSNNAKAIVALAWLAHMPAWMVLDLQEKVAGLEREDCIKPPSRYDFPMSEAEMRWQLRALGHKGDDARQSA